MTRPWHPRLDRIRRRLERLRTLIRAYPQSSVRGPDGEVTTPAELGTRIGLLTDQINRDRRGGSVQHERIGRVRRVVAMSLPALDFVLFAWFMSWTLNVPLRAAAEPALVVALALALLATVAVAAWGTMVGASLRRFKDREGNLVWQAVDATGMAMTGLTLVMAALLGVMMYVRVREEAYQATGAYDSAGLVAALVLAFAAVLVNLYLVYLSFADGSTQTSDRRRSSRVLRRHQRRQDRRFVELARLQQRHDAHVAALTWLRTEPSAVSGRWLDHPAAIPSGIERDRTAKPMDAGDG